MISIATESTGFYKGFNKSVALAAKLVIAALVVWCVFAPEAAGDLLNQAKQWSFTNLSYYYNWSVGVFVLLCLALAVVPKWGRIKLGADDGQPEFSNFSWFSMMFGAGIGIGMLGFATGEPIWYFADNPEIRQSNQVVTQTLQAQGVNTQGKTAEGNWQALNELVAKGEAILPDDLVQAKTESAIESAFRYEFLHWGINAWVCYALVGISLAFFSYRRGLPLTIRSTLEPLFGRALSGMSGHLVDIIAVVATLVGIAQTIGLGLSTFASGLFNITGWSWLVLDEASREPTNAALFLALAVVMLCSTLSALSGVGRGVKWLSNINMVLSIALLSFFLIFGATWLFFEILGLGLIDYLLHLPALTFNVFSSQAPGSPGEWQAQWSVFYWA